MNGFKTFVFVMADTYIILSIPLNGFLIVRLTVEGNSITVNGDTYEIKDFLKQRKFKFDGNRKVWVLNVDNVEEKVNELKHELEERGVIVES